MEMTSQIVGSSIIVAGGDQVSCDLAGEVAILDMKSGVYYGLNAVGALIWDLIQEPKPVDAICEVIVEEYDVDADQCARDVLTLLQELLAHGLVKVCHETAA
jgi:hypothetical protein